MKKRYIGAIGVAALLMVAVLGCQTTKPALGGRREHDRGREIRVLPRGVTARPEQHRALAALRKCRGNQHLESRAFQQRQGLEDLERRCEVSPGEPDLGREERCGHHRARGNLYRTAFDRLYGEVRARVGAERGLRATICRLRQEASRLPLPQFTPTEKGVEGPVTLTIHASSGLAHMDSWSLDVLDQAGGLIRGTGADGSPAPRRPGTARFETRTQLAAILGRSRVVQS